jgi:hypothetical protein
MKILKAEIPRKYGEIKINMVGEPLKILCILVEQETPYLYYITDEKINKKITRTFTCYYEGADFDLDSRIYIGSYRVEEDMHRMEIVGHIFSKAY